MLPPPRLRLGMCLGTFWNPAPLPLVPLAPLFLVVVFFALSSFNADSRAAVRTLLFSEALFLMSSKEAPTTALCTLLARRVRFLEVVSESPFLWRRLHAWVQTSLAAFFLWRVKLWAFDEPSQMGFPSRRIISFPFPG